MNQDKLILEIEDLLHEITDKFAVIKSSQKPSEIDVDIYLEDLRKVYSLSKKISFSELISMPHPISLEENIIMESVFASINPISQVAEEKKEFISEPITTIIEEYTEPSFDFREETQAETPVLKSSPTEVPEIGTPVEFHIPSVTAESVPSTSSGTTTSSDTSTSLGITNKSLDNSLAAKIQQHPIQDIRKSMGLNERFIYINQLFKTDSVSFDATIAFINTCLQKEVAIEHLRTLKDKYHWDAENSDVQSFVELVERKYI